MQTGRLSPYLGLHDSMGGCCSKIKPMSVSRVASRCMPRGHDVTHGNRAPHGTRRGYCCCCSGIMLMCMGWMSEAVPWLALLGSHID